MAAYNGADHLHAQLDTIFGQESVAVELFVRDDGSTDGTVELLTRFAAERRVKITLVRAGTEGNVGTYESWNRLLQCVPRTFGYYAVSDQDDIWLQGKLAAGVQALAAHSDGPAVYTCNTTAVREDLSVIREYDFSSRYPTLPSLFARYAIPAHAMLFNGQLMQLIDNFEEASLSPQFSLEQRILLTALATGGTWVRDVRSFVLWRRVPGRNVTAAGSGVFARVVHELRGFRDQGARSAWAACLLSLRDADLDAASRDFLEMVRDAGQGFLPRLRLATSRELTTGRILFDLLARARVLLPNW